MNRPTVASHLACDVRVRRSSRFANVGDKLRRYSEPVLLCDLCALGVRVTTARWTDTASRKERQDRQEGRQTRGPGPLFLPWQVLGARRALVPGARACGGPLMPQAGLRHYRDGPFITQSAPRPPSGLRRFHLPAVASHLACDVRVANTLSVTTSETSSDATLTLPSFALLA